MIMRISGLSLAVMVFLLLPADASAQGTRSTETYKRIKAKIDAIPSVDTHDHLWPFERLPALTDTKAGKVVNLSGIWRNSYLGGYNSLPGVTRRSGKRTPGTSWGSRGGRSAISRVRSTRTPARSAVSAGSATVSTSRSR